MIEDYKAARKMAEDAVRKAVRSGTSPYLPVLDALEEVRSSAPQTRLGVLELPLSRIKGNKELARNNAFANNFMPLLEVNSEFAMKWELTILPENSILSSEQHCFSVIGYNIQRLFFVFTEA